MDLIYTVIAVIAILIFAFYVVPYLKKKQLITPDNIQLSNDLLLVVKIIIGKNLKNEEDKIKTDQIIDSVRNVIKFIEKDALLTTKEDKISESKKLIINTLSTYGVNVDYESELLIDVLLNHTFRLIR